MKFFASIAAACLLLSVVKAADSIKSCGDSNDLFQVTSVSATPAVAGKGVTVTMAGKVTTEINERATIAFEAKYLLLKFEQPFNVCKVTKKCPIQEGSQTVKFTFTIPPEAKGLTNVSIRGVATQDSTRVFCVEGVVSIA